MKKQLLVVSAVFFIIALLQSCLAAKQDTTTGLFVSTVCGDSNGLAQRTFITAPFFVKALDQDTMCMLDGTMVALIQLSTGSLTRRPINALLAARTLKREVYRTPDGALEFYFNYGNQVKKLDVNGTVVTVGGRLESGFGGDDGLATDALMNTVHAVHVSQEGNVFVADYNNNRIRKIFKNGTIVTVAGNGVCDGLSRVVGGELATNVPICTGTTIRTTTNGEIYFDDLWQIFKISTDGIITKVAGSGVPGFAGDGGLAIDASFDQLFNFDVSPSGQIFLIDRHRVRKIDTNGIITTIAGGSEQGLSWEGGPAVNATLSIPNSISVVNDDVILIADTANRQVKMISHSMVSIIAGRPLTGRGYGGPARDALLYKPQHMTVSPQGDLYFVENYSVHKISATSGLLTTIAGTGTSSSSPDGGLAVETALFYPTGISVSSSGQVYIVDTDRIRMVDQNGLISTVAGIKETFGFSGEGGLATNATFNLVFEVFAAASGVIYILDGVNIRKISQDGIISTIAGNGNMGFSGDGGPALQASFSTPQSIFVTANEEIYIADSGNHRVRKIDNKGIITTVAGGGRGLDDELAINSKITFPNQIVVSPSGHLYIAETNHRIRVVLANSGIITTIAGMKKRGIGGNDILAKNSTLDTPMGVAVTKTGEVYISDTNNNVIRKLSCRNFCGELCTMPCATRIHNQIQTPEMPIGQFFTTPIAYFGIVLAVFGAFALVGCVLYYRTTRKNLSNV